jgi:hypothetical protein
VIFHVCVTQAMIQFRSTRVIRELPDQTNQNKKPKQLNLKKELYMKKTLICKLVALAVAGVVSLSATSAMAAAGSDAFNRPKLGSKWVATSGSLAIKNHRLAGKTLSLGYFTGSVSDTAASAVIFLGGTDLEYGAIALGDIAGGNNAFVKIQAQDGTGSFDSAGFYTGNNVGGVFFTLSSAVPSPATLDVFFCGTVATMRISSAAGIQTYTNDYGTTYGAGGGLGTYGSVGIDNYVGFPSACTDALENAIPVSAMPRATDLSLAK